MYSNVSNVQRAHPVHDARSRVDRRRFDERLALRSQSRCLGRRRAFVWTPTVCLMMILCPCAGRVARVHDARLCLWMDVGVVVATVHRVSTAQLCAVAPHERWLFASSSVEAADARCVSP